MVTTIQVAGLCLTAVFFAKLLERYAAEQALLLTLLAASALTGTAVLSFAPILTEMDRLLTAGGLDAAQTATLSKALGICCVTQLAADVCKDAKAAALETVVQMAGKTALLLLSLPLIQALLMILREVLACVPYDSSS